MGKKFLSIVLISVILILLLIACCVVLYLFGLPPSREIAVAGRTPLINSEIKFYVLDADGSKGRLAGNGTSDEDGVYAIAVEAGPDDYMLAEATGGSYADGINKTRPLLASERLTAVASAAEDKTWLTITPLTHMAATRATELAANGTPLDTAVTSSNLGVARQYGLADIIWNLPVLPDDDPWTGAADIDERDYSLVLAGISDEAEILGVSTMELADALAKDASDGLLDGMDDAAPIDMKTLSGGTARLGLDEGAGIKGVQDGIDAAAVSSNWRPNQMNTMIPLQPMQLGINGAGKFYVTSTMMPAAVAGSKYDFQLKAQGGVPPYYCTILAQNADGTLSIAPSWLEFARNCTFNGDVPLLPGGTTMTISPPFTVSMCDSAGACDKLELRLTTIEKPPQIATEHDVHCFVDEPCNVVIASATGGSPPYYYRSDYLRHGPPPMGMKVNLNGSLTGTPSETGTFALAVCVIDLIGASSCDTATVIVTPRNAILSVHKSGSGSGKVYADPHFEGGVYPFGTSVTLSAKADPGSTFTGWGGDCSGSGTDSECTLVMDSDKEVEAQFEGTEQPSGELSVEIISGSCSVVKGAVSGPVGSYLAVYYSNGGTPVQKINCGSWTPGPDTQYQCIRGDDDPVATGWTASPGSGSVDATVYGSGLSGMKSSEETFRCR